MKVKKSLATQTKFVQAIVDFPIGRSLDMVGEVFSSYGCKWFVILHDKDTKVDDNGCVIPKTKHIHAIFFFAKRLRLSTALGRICEAFDISKIEQVQVLSYDCLAERVQYLVHKNDENKYQYNVDDILTNVSRDELDDLMSQDISVGLSATELIEIICSSNSKKDILIRVGLGNYNTYRNTINDLINEGLLGSTYVKED